MTDALLYVALFILAFNLLVICFLGLAALRRKEPTKPQAPMRIGYRVTVHTRDDQTLFGVVWRDYSDRIVLEDAEYVTKEGGKPIPGRPHIDYENISWIDVHALVSAPDKPPVEPRVNGWQKNAVEELGSP